MSISGIQGQLLELTVVSCHKLKDTEWFARQDPYVCVEYGSSKFRTRTCTDGGKNPTFKEKFELKLVEGLQELNVVVWNSNTLTYDDFIGCGKIQLHKALANGYDDCSWPLEDKTGRHSGEIKLIMHYLNKPDKSHGDALSAHHHHHHHLANAPHASDRLHYPPKNIPEPAPYNPQKDIPEPANHHKSIPEPSPYPSYPPTNPAEYPYHHPLSAYPPTYPPTYPPPPQHPNFYPPGPYPPVPYPPPAS